MQRDSHFIGLGGRDAYEILGVTPLATVTEIRAARRERQKAVHPDRHGDAELSKLVNYAAQILLNDSSRRSYDEFRRRHRAPVVRPRSEATPMAQPAWSPTPPAYEQIGPRGYGVKVILGLLLLVTLALCVGTGVLDELIDRLNAINR